jgi:hypothetical protein
VGVFYLIEIMKEFKGTKGEWEVYPAIVQSSTNFSVSVNKEGLICVGVPDKESKDGNTAVSLCGNGNLKEVQYNAKLIAAAPKLLKALISCVMSMQAHPDNEENSEFEGFVNNGWEAINKALN